MPDVVIENPILNSPFKEPARHFKFTDEGITNEVVSGRRVSQYFIPIAKPRKKGAQLQFDTEWTQDRVEENKFVNAIRQKVGPWREAGWHGVTPVTARLLRYWTDPTREKPLFFCQIEALETAIYITEVAPKAGDAWIANDIRTANDSSNPGLPRVAFKMATGTGKTVVMAMMIAWQALNKFEAPQDPRFSDSFLLVTPGITIRDRLRVLLPNEPENYYRQRDVVSAELIAKLAQAKIVITNYHAFLPREKFEGARLTKELASSGNPGVFTETPDQVARRVCRELGNKKNIIVINDEAHHCYKRKPDGDGEKLVGDERSEAERREEEAKVWISGIEAIKSKIGVRAIYDLSATPFFLRGSGWPEGTLFPWVVSDFSLIDAIEAGIVKVPRVPVSDNQMTQEEPIFRRLWEHIRDRLPKKNKKDAALSVDPKLPDALIGALHALYGNYEKAFKAWESNKEARARGLTQPVFIVVCNNTSVSKLVYDFVAGYERPLQDEKPVVQAGELDLFRNDDGNGGWSGQANTILVDSEQLESGEGMSDEFKWAAAHEIEKFKQEYRVRYPERDVENITDEDLLREVMNTVGKPGKLGEHVRCVVSVSMLTEGWDANTVTHILGVRAFGTQLLCEQVVGRALRRMSYATNSQGLFEPEYAEVYGVPFSFIPCSGATKEVQPGPVPTRVRALEERIACEIAFPRLVGYRFEVSGQVLKAEFTPDSHLALSTADLPTKIENRPIVGEGSVHDLEDLRRRRENEVMFRLARHLHRQKFDNGEDVQPWLFPQLLAITRRWMQECLHFKDDTFPQLLLLPEKANDAADRIYRAIVKGDSGNPTLRAILRPYEPIGSTRFVDFDTVRPVFATRADKCHISHVVADTNTWEQKMAQTLEDMDEVVHYVKNHGLGFQIPYTFEGEERNYLPDFIVRLDDGHGREDLLNLIVEVTGERKKDKIAKTETARTLWVPAVNANGGFGRWAFLEIADPWDAKGTIRGSLRQEGAPA